MSRQAYVRRARHWIANRGWKGFLGEVFYRLRLKMRGQPMPGRENGNTRPHPFDLAYGIDTGGLVWGEALPQTPEGGSAYWATGYYGISPSAFTAALERLHLNWEQYTFVDIGCGKARAMLLATRFPFREILGVELSPELVAVARKNTENFAASWRYPGTRLKAMEGDATQLALPSGALLLFLYHPFAAPVMKRFLAHVQAAAQTEAREILLLYANPELGALLSETPGVERLWKESFALTEEEGAADRFGSYGEVFSVYRVLPSEADALSRHTR